MIGLVGILHQEFVGPVKVELLAVYTTLLGIPGAAHVIALMRGVGSQPRTDSESSLSAQPPRLPQA